ncbi:MAG: AAA family ATPase, partial [Nitrososphaeraceae archaeon]
WDLFKQESQRLGTQLPDNEQAIHNLKQQIQRLIKLTPGDFAVLSRQARFRVEPMELASMLSVLEQECQAKGESFSKIGFVH